ncbi:MAG: hypothetical protein TEF_05685 [Rhizobiales bacterium NRL2]|jgi:cell division protein ZapA|nr:MAG: hypothetical protein TEF_05685 [Rhizobiales bacterium NRL2]
MPHVTVSINGRDHVIGCGEGEEDRVRQLAAFVDKRATELVDGGMKVPDARLMMMTALMIADELATAYEELDTARAGGGSDGGANDGRAREIADRLEALAERMESFSSTG